MDRPTIIKTITTALSFLIFVSINAQTTFPPIIFEIDEVSGIAGSEVCVDVDVTAFIRVEGVQFSIGYDESLLEYVSYSSPLDGPEFFTTNNTPGTLGVLWTDPNSIEGDGETILDNNSIITLCFNLVGDCGKTSPIIFSDFPIPVEVNQISTLGDAMGNDEVYSESGSITIECPTMTIVANKCDATPAGGDGYINFYVAGGSGNYTYTVSILGPPQNSGTTTESENVLLSNLSAGNTYVITATDTATGEMVTESVFVSDNFELELALNVTDPYCWSRATGEIETVVTRGGIEENDAVLQFEWSNFRFTPDIDDLENGTYTVTVTDNTGCMVVETATLFVDTLRVFAEVLDSASCVGNSDAVVRVWAEGGTPFPGGEYEYETSEGDGGPAVDITLNNVPAGTFEYYAIDGANPGCQTDEFELEVPVKDVDLSMIIDSVNVSCFGANDGSVMITGVGSTNFSFQIRNAEGSLVQAGNTPTFSTANNLVPGCYTVTVGDAIGGCSIDSSFCITEPPALELTEVLVSPPSCLGNDGQIQLSTLGGTMPYTYTWNDIASNIEDRVGLMGGEYKVIVTDANGCQDSLSYSFPSGSDVAIDASVVQAIGCTGGMNGIVEANVNVSGNWQYDWETADGSEIFSGQTWSGLGAGTYYVTATDVDNDCEAIDTVILAAGTPIAISANYQMPSCPNTPDGTISIIIESGTPNFTYQWSDQSASQVLSGVEAGSYGVTVTDGNGCEIDTVFVLEGPPEINVNINAINGVDCFGGNNGSATATASGGINGGPFTYFWSNDPTNGQSGLSSTQGGFEAGEQWVIAVDALCASDSIFFQIPDTPVVVIDTMLSQFNSPTCFGGTDGTIWLMAAGGNPANYSYTWPDLGFSGPALTGLAAGSYDVQISDANGCQQDFTVTLEQPDSLSLEINQALSQEISCDGNDGKITVLATGGTMPYNYDWTGINSNANMESNLGEGQYSITVTDVNGCMASTSQTLVAPEPVVAQLAPIAPIECFGGLTCVTVESATGGVGNQYYYTIDNGPNIPADSCLALYADDFTLTVFDSSGFCSQVIPISITQPDEIIVDAGDDIEVNLGAISDPVDLDITSSTFITDISWTPADSLNCLTSDCSSVEFFPVQEQLYTVVVEDENGCSASDELLVMVSARRNVFFPNIFTPNGDETNDIFNVTLGPGAISVSDFFIFDRWGNVVYAIEQEYVPNDNTGWDGRSGGDFVNPGVYVYAARVRFIDGKVIQYGGDLTLIR